MEKPTQKWYKVTNNSDGPVRVSWSIGLLNDQQRAAWEEFKDTKEFVGENEVQREARKKMTENDKLKAWANQQHIGVAVFITHKNEPGRDVWMFELRQGINILNEEQVKSFRRYEIKEIEQTLKPGQVKPEKQKEGFVTIELLTNKEVRKLTKKMSKNKNPEAKKEALEKVAEELKGEPVEINLAKLKNKFAQDQDANTQQKSKPKPERG